MEKQEILYEACKLYVLKPSKIINIEGDMYAIKISLIDHEIEVVEQNITFKTIPNQIIIAQKAPIPNQYIPIFNKSSDDYDSFFGYGKYYDIETLKKQGLFERMQKANFVGIVPYDIIPLQNLKDLEFIQNLGQIGIIKSLKYFSSKGKLKPKYQQPTENKQYTIEQLKTIKQYLIQNTIQRQEQPEISTRTYKIIKEPKKIYLSAGTKIPSRDNYAGTEECLNIKLKKTLKRKLT